MSINPTVDEINCSMGRLDNDSFVVIDKNDSKDKVSVGGYNFKFLYYVNQLPVPYIKQLYVSNDGPITLRDIRQLINLPNFKYYAMVFDTDFRTTAKYELLDTDKFFKEQATSCVFYLQNTY